MPVDTIRWTGRSVRIIDQTRLPEKLVYLDCRDVDALWHAIRMLKVRGAPALGIAAAFAVILGLQSFKGKDTAKAQEPVLRTFKAEITAKGPVDEE